MKNILVLGDSFSYGHGCSDRETVDTLHYKPSDYCWPSLLANDLSPDEYNIINLSKPGNSIMGVFNDLLNHSGPVDMLIFGVTSFDRLLIADPFNPDNTTNWIVGGELSKHESIPMLFDYNKSKEMYFKYLINDKTMHLNKLAYMGALFNYASSNNIKCLYNIPNVIELDSKIGFDALNDLRFIHLYDFDYSANCNYQFNNTCTVADGHPNNLGHSIYYERVIKPKVLTYIKVNL